MRPASACEAAAPERMCREFDFGKGAAVGVIILLINLIFALIYLSFGRKKAKAVEE